MGLCLIAVTWDLPLLVVILEVAVALGMVIFVHELGHFLVAKACGVKCEKFYLGFDIYGLKLCKFRRGETEYGIGILPLGGYVKMLGQEDNPARLREEIQRAKQQAGATTTQGVVPGLPASAEAATRTGGQAARLTSASSVESSSPKSARGTPAPEGQPIDVAAAERALFDPRSYLAKSVPQRMAIISAGVIMNVIFAFLCAAIAYPLGVKQIAAGVGLVFPGEAAWQAGLRVGDEIEEINGEKVSRFGDVLKGISLGDNLAEGIRIVVRRPSVPQPLSLTVFPDRIRLRPTIGVGNPWITTLNSQGPSTHSGSPAWQAEPRFQSGDRIVKIDDQPIESYAQIDAYLATHPEKALKVAIERPLDKKGSDASEPAGDAVEQRHADRPPHAAPPTALTIDVAPNPMRELGLQMALGELSAIQTDSPAAKAGLRKGDLIEQIDGEPVGDPMTLPERLRRRAGQTVTLTVRREGAADPIRVEVPLRPADWYEQPLTEGSPMSVPQLGIAYGVLNRVEKVTAGSPAAKADLHAGAVVAQATVLPPDEKTLKKYEEFDKRQKVEQEKITIKFGPKQLNWPFFAYVLQNALPGSQVELLLEDGRKVTIEPEPSAQWFDPDRGFRFDPQEFTETAHSLGEAVRLGWRETAESLTMVLSFLRKIGTQISPRALGGPIMIFTVAKGAAYEGLSTLLIFLTMLSANLAVLNFLPIPVLDGGHMVFLIWEGIRGKPADERVQMTLTYLGFIFIVGLMIWVIGLDVGLISRQVSP